jgi:hypothetical protein
MHYIEAVNQTDRRALKAPKKPNNKAKDKPKNSKGMRG